MGTSSQNTHPCQSTSPPFKYRCAQRSADQAFLYISRSGPAPVAQAPAGVQTTKKNPSTPQTEVRYSAVAACHDPPTKPTCPSADPVLLLSRKRPPAFKGKKKQPLQRRKQRKCAIPIPLRIPQHPGRSSTAFPPPRAQKERRCQPPQRALLQGPSYPPSGGASAPEHTARLPILLYSSTASATPPSFPTLLLATPASGVPHHTSHPSRLGHGAQRSARLLSGFWEDVPPHSRGSRPSVLRSGCFRPRGGCCSAESAIDIGISMLMYS
jgi:hypothetical protein